MEESVSTVKQLHIKHKSRVGRNTAWYTTSTIPHVRGDSQLGSLALGHLGNTIVPPSNHFTLSNVELKRLSAIPGAVNLLAIGECENIVAGHPSTRGGEGCTITWLQGLGLHNVLTLTDGKKIDP